MWYLILLLIGIAGGIAVEYKYEPLKKASVFLSNLIHKVIS